jgi:hypothetical protein
VAIKNRNYFRLWVTLSLVTLIGLLTSLSACAAPQGTRAQQATSNPPIPNREAAAQAISTRIAEKAGLDVTTQALQTQAASLPTPTSTMVPTLDTPPPSVNESLPNTVKTNLPADIVLPPGEQTDLFVSQNLITVRVKASFNQVLGFYEEQMALNGWQKEAANSFSTDSAAQLIFTKDNLKVSISLRYMRETADTGYTAIVITIQS